MNDLDLYKQAQKKVISILLNGTRHDFDTVLNKLPEEYFTDIRYKFILRAIEWIYDNGHTLSPLSLINCLAIQSDAKGKSYLSYLDPDTNNPEKYINDVIDFIEDDDSNSLMTYIKMVSDKFGVSNIVSMANKILRMDACGQLTIGKARNIIEEYAVYLQDEQDKDKPKTLQKILQSMSRDIDNAVDEFSASIKTDIKLIDKAISLEPTNVTIIGADTSHGKSSLALQIAWNIAKQQKVLVDNITGEALLDENGRRKYGHRVVVFFSLEMSDKELGTKLLCNALNISYQEFIQNHSNIERKRMIDEFEALMPILTPNLIIDYQSFSKEDIYNRCRELKVIYGSIDLVVIDYIQLVEEVNKSAGKREDSVYREISRFFKKTIAGKLNTHVVALSQLRNPDTDRNGNLLHRPTMFRLFGSSAFRCDASNILLVFREWTAGQKMTTVNFGGAEGEKDISTYLISRIIFAKVRMGENAIEKVVGFYPTTQYFLSLRELIDANADLSKADFDFRMDISKMFLEKKEIVDDNEEVEK